jgi:hypothetical protein
MAVLAVDELNAEPTTTGVFTTARATTKRSRSSSGDVHRSRTTRRHTGVAPATARPTPPRRPRGIVARCQERRGASPTSPGAGRRAEEAREAQRVLTMNGWTRRRYNLALIYEERGEWQRAIEHFEQFLANAGAESAALTVDVRTRVQALRARLQ